MEERLTEVEILRRNMAPVSLQTVSTEYLVWGRGRGSPRGEDPHQVIELDISRAGAVYAVKPAPPLSSSSLTSLIVTHYDLSLAEDQAEWPGSTSEAMEARSSLPSLSSVTRLTSDHARTRDVKVAEACYHAVMHT